MVVDTYGSQQSLLLMVFVTSLILRMVLGARRN